MENNEMTSDRPKREPTGAVKKTGANFADGSFRQESYGLEALHWSVDGQGASS